MAWCWLAAVVQAVRERDKALADKAAELEKLAGEFEADVKRCEDKRDRDGEAGNVDGEAYWQGKGHAFVAAASRLRGRAEELRGALSEQGRRDR